MPEKKLCQKTRQRFELLPASLTFMVSSRLLYYSILEACLDVCEAAPNTQAPVAQQTETETVMMIVSV